ncbi:hypothetical protein EON65_05600 [archaeon]|nr:MAG: hypothetical protein EON65_05600 [archaeon]
MCVFRQNGGFEGRTNKVVDSCYAFWIGASLSMLGAFEDVDIESTNAFILEKCQVTKHTGGFRKYEDSYPDLLHSFYSVCWLSLSGTLKSLDPALAIPLDKSRGLK